MATSKTYRNTSKAMIHCDGQMVAPGGVLTLDADRAAELSKSLSFGSLTIGGQLVEEKAPAADEKKAEKKA